MRSAAAALALLLAIPCSLACGAGPVSPQGVILVSVDALRADRLGCYGYERETTPGLDRLAKEGVLFEQASAAGAWTVPSHTTLLTGLYPHAHGMRYANNHLPEDIPTLAAILSEHGYATGAVVNVHLLSARRGFSRGFGEFLSIPESNREEGSAEQINGKAIDWLQRNGKRPFFLFLHYYDVHSDYRPLPRYRELFSEPYSGIANGGTEQLKQHRRGEITLGPRDARFLSNLYDAGVRQFDDSFSRFLSRLREQGLLDRTLLVITSDHGEEFLEHGDFLHSRTLFQELIHVPLILRGPGLPHGLRIEEPVSLVDVVPTVTALLGIATPEAVEGIDLSGLWMGDHPKPAQRPIFAEADQWAHNVSRSHIKMVRLGDHTLHWDSATNRYSLYDLSTDPGETKDIAEREPGIVRELQSELERYMQTSRQGEMMPPPTPEEIQRLRSLGYLD